MIRNDRVPTSASIRSRSNCRSCRRRSATASPSCLWSLAMPSAESVAQVLERLWGGAETLIVISSDLSHYLPLRAGAAADRATVQRILALDAGLAPHEACGSLRRSMARCWPRAATPSRRACSTLCNSGDTAGERDRVVGYGAIAFEERQDGPMAEFAPGRWWHRLDDGRIQCDLCPRDCQLHEGQRGLCFVRQSAGDADGAHHLRPLLRLLHRPDREEAAQPLLSRHAACSRSAPPAATSPASSARTGTSRSRARWTACSDAGHRPRRSPRRRARCGCTSVAFTYNDPVIFAEYAMDTADACHALGHQDGRRDRGLHARRSRGASSTRRWTRPTSI